MNTLLEEKNREKYAFIKKNEFNKVDEKKYDETDEAANVENTQIVTEMVSSYLKEISKYKVLTKEEERELFARYKNGDQEARDLIFKHNLKLVISIAKKYAGIAMSMDLMDVIMEGNIGLSTAIDKFDLNQDVKFSTYACWWIKQNLLREIMNQDKIIRLPVHIGEDMRRVAAAKRAYDAEHNEEPSIEWLAKRCNISKSRVRTAEYQLVNCTLASLDCPVGEEMHGKCSSLGDFIEDTTSAETFEAIENFELREAIQKMLDKYPERDQEVIKRRFGWYGEVETLDEIGKTYGVTRERIRQIEAKVLRDFRRPKNRAKLRVYNEK